jgi:hypothetical protein
MQVQVNISQQQGAPVTANAAARTTPAYQTSVFEQNGKDVEQRIASIINANLSTENTANAKAK